MLLIGGFILFVILFLSGMWLLSFIGPRAATEEELAEREGITTEELENRRAEVTKLSGQFDALSADGTVSPEDLEVIALAIRKQRELVRLQPYAEATDLDQLAVLEERYATAAGAVLHAASLEDEAAAKVAAAEGRTEDALAAYTRAIERQDEINRLYARGEFRDVSRLRKLELARENLQAEPLARRARELTQEARLLLTEDPGRAAELLREAADLHARLMRDFRSSRFSDRAAQREVASLLVDVEAASLFHQRESFRSQAAVAVEEERYEDAADLVERAIEVQRQLVARFPESSYAAPNALAALEEDRQSAMSTRLARTVDAHEVTLQRQLRAREVAAAASTAAALFRDLRRLHDTYQSSRFLDEDRLLRARFLNLKRDDFGIIQDAVYERLRLIPGEGEDGVRMLKVEVPQLLYSLVMGTNPSSQRGDLLPVESVDFSAAIEFCERLGWILGWPVSLPTREQFEQALGEVSLASVAARAWSSRLAERKIQTVGTREANAAGFYDLLGNVAEWIDERRPGDDRQALTIGGSVRDTPESLTRVPTAYAALSERSRFTGFRVVVEVGKTDE